MPIGIQVNLAGKTFGKLKVLRYVGRRKNYLSMWECRCACGRTIVAATGALQFATRSCGCVHGVAVSNPITQEQLKKLVKYDRLTGYFYARVDLRGVDKGERLGTFDRSTGYALIGLGGEQYFSHQLAWLYVKGVWPSKYMDHKDRDKINNAFKNLREATGTQNNANRVVRKDSKSGLKGVRFLARQQKWEAYIGVESKFTSLGYFSTAEDAGRAYDKAAIRCYGEYARLNFSEAA